MGGAGLGAPERKAHRRAVIARRKHTDSMTTKNDNSTKEARSSAAHGSETPRWGLGRAVEIQMSLMEAVLKHYDDATNYSAAQDGNAEAGEIIAEGVEHFMAASAGVAPAQRLMVGVKYCLLALKEWRLHGPEGESQNE